MKVTVDNRQVNAFQGDLIRKQSELAVVLLVSFTAHNVSRFTHLKYFYYSF